ncbi:MAG TPA: hypothetical protein VGM98_25885 [Schlesneria sp.]|jgi:hypothetical protein
MTNVYDMRGNVVAGIVVVMAGAGLLRCVKPPTVKTTRRFWIPVVALISGPVVTFGYCLLDAYSFSPGSYTQPGDFAASAVPVTIVGIAAGVFGAAVLWLADR